MRIVIVVGLVDTVDRNKKSHKNPTCGMKSHASLWMWV
jgi:hypothetical protein